MLDSRRRGRRWHATFDWCGAGVLALLVVTTTLGSLLAPADALAITRNAVLARAQTWVNNPVPYSQAKYFGGYRTDCSGYVSMVWQTGTSWSTSTMHSVSHKITSAQLQPGDVMLKAGTHVKMFYGWADDAHTTYVAYEQTGPNTKSSVKNLAYDVSQGYIPFRYNNITDSPPVWNAALNSAFNVWAAAEPVWWQHYLSGAGTTWKVRTDKVGSSKFGLGLTNPNSTPSTYAEAQNNTAPVQPGVTYTLSALAGTTTNPSAVQMRLKVFNASNATVADVSTTGNVWGIGAGALKPMSLSVVMPAGAVKAVTYLHLSGSTNASGTSGGTAAFDDVTLQVTSPLPVYRFFNKKNGSHFYTAAGSERDMVADNLTSTYSYEGVAYGVKTSAANSVPLYRFFKPSNGSHFYTSSVAERDRIKAKLSGTYHYEGIAYNVSDSAAGGATPVFRFFKPSNGSHFYTNSVAERDDVRTRLKTSYNYEGVAFYLAP